MSYQDTLKQKLHGYNARRLKNAIERQLKSAQTLERVAAEGHHQRHAIAIELLLDRAFIDEGRDSALFAEVAESYNLDCLQHLAIDIAEVVEPQHEFDGLVVDEYGPDAFVVRDPHILVTRIEGSVALAICFASEPYAGEEAVQATLRGAGYVQVFGDVHMVHGQTWLKPIDDFAYHVVEVIGQGAFKNTLHSDADNLAYIHSGYVYLRDTDPQYIKSACQTMDTQRTLRRILESDAMDPEHKKELARRVLAHDLFHYGGFASAFAEPRLPAAFGKDTRRNWHFVQDQLPRCLSY